MKFDLVFSTMVSSWSSWAILAGVSVIVVSGKSRPPEVVKQPGRNPERGAAQIYVLLHIIIPSQTIAESRRIANRLLLVKATCRRMRVETVGVKSYGHLFGFWFVPANKFTALNFLCWNFFLPLHHFAIWWRSPGVTSDQLPVQLALVVDAVPAVWTG